MDIDRVADLVRRAVAVGGSCTGRSPILAIGERAAGIVRLNSCGNTSAYAPVEYILSAHYAVSHAAHGRRALYLCPDASGAWFESAVPLGRNHYDRLVDFCFGFLLTYPVEELFRLASYLRGWLSYYLPVLTILGLSGLWEIVESWVARAVHPEAGITYLGSQADIWDAQKDIMAAFTGAMIMAGLGWLDEKRRTSAGTRNGPPAGEG